MFFPFIWLNLLESISCIIKALLFRYTSLGGSDLLMNLTFSAVIWFSIDQRTGSLYIFMVESLVKYTSESHEQFEAEILKIQAVIGSLKVLDEPEQGSTQTKEEPTTQQILTQLLTILKT